MRFEEPYSPTWAVPYTFLPDEFKECVSADTWGGLPAPLQRFFHHIVRDLERFLQFQTLPPGNTTTEWTHDEIAIFRHRIQYFYEHNVQPSRHWGLFSIVLPQKTGRQCMCFAARHRNEFRFPDTDRRDGIAHIHREAITLVRDIVWASPLFAKDVCEHDRIETEQARNEAIGVTAHPGGGWNIGVDRCYLGCMAQICSRLNPLKNIYDRLVMNLGSETECGVSWRVLKELMIDVEKNCSSSLDNLAELLTSAQRPEGHNDIQEFMMAFLDRLIEDIADDTLKTETRNLFRIVTRRIDYRTAAPFVDDNYCGWTVHLNERSEHPLDFDDVLIASMQRERVQYCPPILLVYIQRLEFTSSTGCVAKNCTQIRPVQTLVLEHLEYRFAACVLHAGEADHGHYIIVFRSGDKLICADGPDLREVHWDEIMHQDSPSPFCATYFVYTRDPDDWAGCFLQRAAPKEKMHSRRDTGQRGADSTCACALPSHPRTPARPVPREGTVSGSFKLPVPKGDRGHKRSHLSEHEKLFIAYSAGAGVSFREIAAALNRHHTTVSRFAHAPLAHPMKRATPALAENLLSFVLNASILGRRMSCRRTAQALLEEHGVSLSHETIRKIRRLHGLRFLAPIPRCKLLPKHVEARKRFAEFWTRGRRLAQLRATPIIFTDESRFVLEMSGRKLWRMPGEAAESDYVDREQGPISVMVWGGIGLGYKTRLIRFEKTCTQTSYLNLLDEQGIIDDINNVFSRKAWFFQQDNAPAHTAKKVKKWLLRHTTWMVNWPAKSPDLNPIEHMWAICKQRIDVSRVTNADELFAEVKRVWDEIPQSVVDSLVTSFEARLRAVHELEGKSLNGKWEFVRKWHKALSDGGIYDDYRLEELPEDDYEDYSDGSEYDDEPSSPEEEAETEESSDAAPIVVPAWPRDHETTDHEEDRGNHGKWLWPTERSAWDERDSHIEQPDPWIPIDDGAWEDDPIPGQPTNENPESTPPPSNFFMNCLRSLGQRLAQLRRR